MADRAETRLIAELEIVGVIVDVLHEIFHAVRTSRGRFRGTALTARIEAEYDGAAAGKFDAILRHGRFGTGEPGNDEHRRRGIFFRRVRRHVHRDGIRRIVFHRIGFAVDLALVIGFGHFFRQREIGNLDGKTRRFENHCRETAHEHQQERDAHGHETFRLIERFLFLRFPLGRRLLFPRDVLAYDHQFVLCLAEISDRVQNERRQRHDT